MWKVSPWLYESILYRLLIKPLLTWVPGLCGHFYKPVCWVEQHPYSPIHGRRVYQQYTCEHCGKKTKMMGQKELKAFLIKHCPTWGPPGGDSQGYRDADYAWDDERKPKL
ncbi:hypothetical protein HNP46_006354 [Pseudomonas nitritireducens]|uniref:Uncharacterized protein n=1 Tax=Pseudomonas nitroreducens TaxID=46680 RepID=A0A7W7P471_PSENT|nr:hypothetical protein [Pseudomonas nitritireducens]MBB4867441.1 hypothetical protein [Pseudomonas nitritireducens]